MERPGFIEKAAGLAALIGRDEAARGSKPEPVRRRLRIKGSTARGWITPADGATVPDRRRAQRQSRRRMQAASRRRNRAT